MEDNKDYLLIENKGEVDVNALILMGGSTKRDSNTAIGFFGSGNKYAIALMLRKQIPFRIFSGEKELVITTRTVGFREKSFEQILINGIETSLTTEMGPQWDSWMGIREWVSNAIDEGEHRIMNSATEIRPKTEATRIYIEHHADIQEVIKNWDRYFSFDRTDCLFDAHGDKVFPQTDREKETLLFYRKGIQCYTSNSKALYSYDLKTFDINESRVISDTWAARRALAKFLCANVSRDIAVNILGNAFIADKGYIEAGLDYHSYMPTEGLCISWREAIGDRIIVNNNVSGFYSKEMQMNKHFRVSREMAKAIKASFADVPVYGIGQDDDSNLNWRIVDRTPKIEYILKKALEFLKDADFAVNYPIEVVEFDQPEVLGTIDKKNKVLLVASKAFDNGMKDTVMTIMEEHIHLQEGLKDESRAFEQFLIRGWLSEKELRIGVFL